MSLISLAQSGQPEGAVHIARDDEWRAFNRLQSLCGAVFSGVSTERHITCKDCFRLRKAGIR
jgi:hypothetical protein